MNEDRRIGEKHGKMTIICKAQKEPNGYLPYYWCECDCGNVKRLRYDQARRVGDCGLCEDFTKSGVLKHI